MDDSTRAGDGPYQDELTGPPGTDRAEGADRAAGTGHAADTDRQSGGRRGPWGGRPGREPRDARGPGGGRRDPSQHGDDTPGAPHEGDPRRGGSLPDESRRGRSLPSEPRQGGTWLGGTRLGGRGPREEAAEHDRPWERKDKRKDSRRDSGVLVIGLGRFGSAIAATLDRLGQDVLAVERDPELVAQWSGRIPLVEADAANPEALEQLGARDFSVAVVGVGSYLEASVLITGNLVDIGTPQIWSKAISAEHARILQRIGAHHVVLPEADAGSRVAHLVSGKMLDYIEVEDGFTVVKMRPPRETQGFTIAQSRIRERYGVTVIGVKSPGIDFVYATPDTRISANDLLVVSGHADLLERFAARP